MCTILYIQWTHFIKKLTQFYIFNIQKNFNDCIKFCIFDMQNFSKNVHIYVYSMYTVFWCVDIFLCKLLRV